MQCLEQGAAAKGLRREGIAENYCCR